MVGVKIFQGLTNPFLVGTGSITSELMGRIGILTGVNMDMEMEEKIDE